MRAFRSAVAALLPRRLRYAIWDAYYYYLAVTSGRLKKTSSVTLEVTDVCDIRCSACPVPRIQRAKGLMTLSDFKVILDKLPPSVKTLRMNYAGEPLLNADIFRMIRYSKDQRPDIYIRVSTNGTHLGKFAPEEITGSGLDQLDVALDGITKEVHEDYRTGSNFDEIAAAAAALCRYKAAAGAALPKIVQMTLLHKRNSAILPQIEEFARKTGFDELHLRYMWLPAVVGDEDKIRGLFSYFGGMEPGKFGEMRDKYVPDPAHSEYEEKDGRYVIREEMRKCYSFLSPLIFYNGDVGVCCHDAEGSSVFGNLLREEFAAVMTKMPAGDVYHKRLPICEYCDLSWLGANWKEIKLK